MENTTPMLRQFLEIKKQHPGTILFFRLGDFYEMFNEDAVIGSRELEITLTARQKDSPNPIPMCGIPHHAAASYIARLVRKGYKVAICEQTEEAGKGVKLVRREVVRVITPGTAIDPQMLESKESTYLAAIFCVDDEFGAAFLELSAGDLVATQFSGDNAIQKVVELAGAYQPREILFPPALEKEISRAFASASGEATLFDDPAAQRRADGPLLTPVETELFAPSSASELMCRQFGVRSLDGFGIAEKTAAIGAAGACLAYAQKTQNALAGHITSIEYFEASDSLVLDAVTLRNLEIVDGRGGSSKRTLFDVIDSTVNGMGARLLRQWLVRPSLKRKEIETRLAAVEELSDSIMRETLRFLLKEVSDLERLTGRINLGTASPRDLIALSNSLSKAPEINSVLADSRSLLLQVLSENVYELPETRDLIARAIAEEPPANLADGGVIKAGFNAELDELRSLSSTAKQTIAAFENTERSRSGIHSLKIRFNNVFGYFIEVPKAQITRVPTEYERRQTLANAERYTTPELKEWETKVLNADERIARLENELFLSVRDEVKAQTVSLRATARGIATLDCLAALAETAARRNYVRPTLHDGDEIEIKNGRHPMVEAFLKVPFIPNDTLMNNSTDRLLVITGSNMGGKSTILRQIALIQILAQIGSFVPATRARLPIVDRVWTRVGASDDLATGRSTFMVEMTETAAILRNATPRSLVLLDEIGRGTSTFDGLSIAWAVAEYLHNSPDHSAKTLFATHYHELTELADSLPGAKNYQISATEKDGEIVFFHKLQPGKASKSYGIAVARLAGLPASVIEQAKHVLAKLEQYELAVFAEQKHAGLAKAAGGHVVSQASLFSMANERALDAIRDIDLSKISDAEAREILNDVRSRMA